MKIGPKEEPIPIIEADEEALKAMEAAEKELEETYDTALNESRVTYTLVRGTAQL